MDATALPPRQKTLALFGVLLGMLLAALDNTIVSTAGPTIQQDLKIDPGLYVWITTAYLVSSTVLVPIWGKLSDTLGRRRVLLAGIGIFLLGSVLCGVSGSATQLILFRAVQGVGSASLFTSAFAIIGDMYSPRERGRLNGFFGAVFGLSSVIGPLVGGFITDNLGWHWCFFVNVPLGILAAAFILARMPPLLPREQKKLSIDVAGSVALAVGVVPLLVALSLGKATVHEGETGFLWTSWEELSLFGLAVAGTIAFVFVETRARDPIVDLKLFQNRAYAIGSAAAFVAGLMFLGAIVFLPLFMQNVVGEHATGAGLTTMPLTLGIVTSNIISGTLTTKTGKYKPFIVGSLVIAAVAFAILAFTLDVDATKASTSWKMFLIGVGMGPSIPLFALAIQNAVPPEVVGVASSMATFARQMGATIGIAIMGTVFATTLSSEIEDKMKVATAGVPPAMLAQMKQQQQGAGGRQGYFDRELVEKRVHEGFAHQRVTIEKAVKDNDPAAVKELEASPFTDERLKRSLAGGGVGAQVKAGFDATIARVKAAIEQGPEAVAALAADESLPLPLRENLKRIPPPALQSPEARAQIESRIEVGLKGAESAAEAQAVAGVLEKVNGALDHAEGMAIETVGKVDHALKQAFTDAVVAVYKVAIVLAILALLAALPLPPLPLRQRGPSGPPTE